MKEIYMTQFSSDKTLITKENAYPILKAFAKEYKKQNGASVPIELQTYIICRTIG